MGEFWGLIFVGIIAFLATMVDEIFVLLALFLDKSFSYKKVVLGQFFGVSIVLLISGLSYFFKFIIPEEWIGLLGIIPLYFGIRDLIKYLRGIKEDETFVKINDYEIVTVKEYEAIQIQEINFKKFFKSNSKIFFVTFIAVANGMDSIGVYAPLFVTMTWLQMLLLDLIFLIITGITCLLPYYIVRNPIIGKVIRKLGYNLNQIILIILGLVVMYENGTFSAIWRFITNHLF